MQNPSSIDLKHAIDTIDEWKKASHKVQGTGIYSSYINDSVLLGDQIFMLSATDQKKLLSVKNKDKTFSWLFTEVMNLVEEQIPDSTVRDRSFRGIKDIPVIKKFAMEAMSLKLFKYLN